jgi:hypothetical protein
MKTNMTNLENALRERTVPLKFKTDTVVVPMEFKYRENSHCSMTDDSSKSSEKRKTDVGL